MNRSSRIQSLPPLLEVIRRFDLSPRKSLGQNFLLDLNITNRIARIGGDLTQYNIIEIGPGPGGLTRALLNNRAKQITTVERDPRCVAAIHELAAHFPNKLKIVEGDALKTRVQDLAEPPIQIIANLPYNIATPLLLSWLRDLDGITHLVLMFQREVADRLAAKPGTKAYGRLSVITQWLCEVRPAFNLPKKAFIPPPKVISTVIELKPRPNPLAKAQFESLEAVTAAAFGQRRKMLRSSLKSLHINPAKAGIDPTRRAEELMPEEFCALARLINT